MLSGLKAFMLIARKIKTSSSPITLQHISGFSNYIHCQLADPSKWKSQIEAQTRSLGD